MLNTAPKTTSRFRILNTNKGNNDTDQELMLNEGIAAAFYDPWKHNISRIKADDWVFLYENRKGIIAFGQGSGEVLKRDHEGNADECYCQKLNGFTKLAEPFSASDIKRILGRNIVY